MNIGGSGVTNLINLLFQRFALKRKIAILEYEFYQIG